VILSVVGSVANGYLQLRALDEQLAIARRTLGTYAESVRLFELQFKYGLKPQMTVEQARISYETAAAKVPQLESQVAQTENLLSVLLGRNPGPIPRGKSILEFTMPAVPAGVPSELLERRPDIRQAEQNLVAVNAQLGAAKALYYPTISLTGVFGQSSSELGNLFDGPSRVWSYGGSIVGPLFTGGAISGQVRQVEAAREAALLGYEAAIQAAFADVDNALVARAKLVDQVAAQERLVTASREYARLARLQFDGGVTPYFTVLQAEQQLFPAELNLVATRAALFASLVDLYKAMGGGWVGEGRGIGRRGGGEHPSCAAGLTEARRDGVRGEVIGLARCPRRADHPSMDPSDTPAFGWLSPLGAMAGCAQKENQSPARSSNCPIPDPAKAMAQPPGPQTRRWPSRESIATPRPSKRRPARFETGTLTPAPGCPRKGGPCRSRCRPG